MGDYARIAEMMDRLDARVTDLLHANNKLVEENRQLKRETLQYIKERDLVIHWSARCRSTFNFTTDMEAAKRNDDLKILLVEFNEGSLRDVREPELTIGWNTFSTTGADTWVFAGWSNPMDTFTIGEGRVIAWAPFEFPKG